MALYANGTDITSVTVEDMFIGGTAYPAVDVKRVYANGTLVWTAPFNWSGSFDNVLLSYKAGDSYDITVDVLTIGTNHKYIDVNSDGTNSPCTLNSMYFDGTTFQGTSAMGNTEIKMSVGEKRKYGNIGYFRSPGTCQLQFGYTWCAEEQSNCDPSNTLKYTITGYVTYDPSTRTWSGSSSCPNSDGDNYILRPVAGDSRYIELYFEQTNQTYGQISLGI